MKKSSVDIIVACIGGFAVVLAAAITAKGIFVDDHASTFIPEPESITESSTAICTDDVSKTIIDLTLNFQNVQMNNPIEDYISITLEGQSFNIKLKNDDSIFSGGDVIFFIDCGTVTSQTIENADKMIAVQVHTSEDYLIKDTNVYLLNQYDKAGKYECSCLDKNIQTSSDGNDFIIYGDFSNSYIALDDIHVNSYYCVRNTLPNTFVNNSDEDVDYNYEYTECTDYNYEYTECTDYNYEYTEYTDYNYEYTEYTDYNYEYTECTDYNYEYTECTDYNYEYTECTDYNYEYTEYTDYNYEYTEYADYNYEYTEYTDYNYEYTEYTDYDYVYTEYTDYNYEYIEYDDYENLYCILYDVWGKPYYIYSDEYDNMYDYDEHGIKRYIYHDENGKVGVYDAYGNITYVYYDGYNNWYYVYCDMYGNMYYYDEYGNMCYTYYDEEGYLYYNYYDEYGTEYSRRLFRKY